MMNKLIVIFSMLVFISCKKDDKPEPPATTGKYTNGLLVLNEGLFQQNNASLSFYSFDDSTCYLDVFQDENNRGLGDTGNDLVSFSYNGINYDMAAIDISSQLEIIIGSSLKSVKQIPLFENTMAREPRCISIYNNKAFVCNFDGTISIISLATFTETNSIAVGQNPDGMIQVGDKLFVSNSGGLNFPVYDSTITVIDMNSETVIDVFETRINGTQLVKDSQGEIYQLSNGNYGSIAPAIIRINTQTHQVLNEINVPASSLMSLQDVLIYYDTNSKTLKKYNMLTETFIVGDFIDCSAFTTFGGVQDIPEINALACYDVNGYVNSSIVKIYSYSGEFLFEFTAGLNASKIVYHE